MLLDASWSMLYGVLLYLRVITETIQKGVNISSYAAFVHFVVNIIYWIIWVPLSELFLVSLLILL